MTLAERIERMKKRQDLFLIQYYTDIKVAIRSLEAWENVKEDILKSISMIENADIINGYMISLAIIDKHLKGVTE